MPYLRILVFVLLAFIARAQDVRITEFMPVNTAGLKDEDLNFAPWIEIWNTDTANKVVLTSWRLVHGASQWTFPATMEIAPGDYLVVFADGKNRTALTAPLHTSFTLNAAGGGPLTLLNNAGSTVSTFTSYPALPANVSYGRDGAQLSQVGSYTSPTPGEANNYSGTGVAGKVVMSLGSRAFTGTLSIALSQAAPVAGATIRYTTNGTVPLSTSTAYSTPITISSTIQLRARVFLTGKLPGETETAGYLLLDGTTSTFNTAAPIVVVSNFAASATFPDTGDQAGFMWVWEPSLATGRARFLNSGVAVLPTIATRCAVDRRGSSTLTNAKTNFNLEARKGRDDADDNIALLGMPDGSDWVFHAPFNFDRSLLHNPLMYALSNSIGRQAVRTKMAEVFVETTGGALNFTGAAGGDYYGVYNVMEKIRRGKDRVDVKKLDTYDNGAVTNTGGYIFKVDRQDTGDSGFTAGGQTFAYYYPKEVEIKAPQRDPQEQALSAYINSFNTALFSGTYTNPTTGYAAWLDVPEAVDHHLMNVWAFNVDGLRLSGYLHKERGGKLLFGPIWDFDRALSSTDGRDSDPLTWRSQTGDLGTDFFNYIWWSRLFTDANFYQKYIDRWVELRRGAFAPATVNALIDSLNAQLTTEGVNRDLARWGNAKRDWTRTFTPFNTIAASQAAEVQRLKDYLEQRAQFFETQWVKPVTFSSNGGNISPGLSLTMTAAAGSTIRYTIDGSDPRPSGGGAAGAGVLTYTGPITINATTRVKARAYNAGWTALTGANNPPLSSRWSGLTNVRFATEAAASPATLAVTEVNFHPLDPSPAELAINPVFSAADFEFIELKNVGATAISLEGVQLTTGVTFTFSNGVAMSLQPGQFAVVAANPSAFAARYGAIANVVGPFAGDLANSGERLVVTSASGATIADFTYVDTWYPASDGAGNTLAIYDPLAPAAAFGTAANWRASAAIGGSPGADEPNRPPVVSLAAEASGNVSGVAVSGTASDDRLPGFPGTLTYSWSLAGGPGTATFTPPNAIATTASFSVPGLYVARLTANDGSLTGVGEMSVFAKDTPAAWLARNPGIGALDDDFDGDGWSNFTEFSLGLDPATPNVNARPVPTMENGCLTLTYSRIKPPASVTYSIEVADALTAFRAPNPGEVTEQILTDNGLIQTVKIVDTVSTAGPPARFLRLKVSPTP